MGLFATNPGAKFLYDSFLKDLLKKNESSIDAAMAAAKGIEDGVFLIVGSLKPRQGGTIIAHAETPEALELRVAADPFVRENVVSAEILELSVNKVAEGLEFLLADRMG